MDVRVIVFAASLGLLGFLFYPRPVSDLPPGTDEWVSTVRPVEGGPTSVPRTRRANPAIHEYDLGFIYRIDRIRAAFEDPTDNGPKLFEVRVKEDEEKGFRRAFSYRSSSRMYPYTVQGFQDTYEARWVQIIVSDWFTSVPRLESFDIGPVYRRDWSPIRSVTTSHHRRTASYLIDGIRSQSAAWIAADVEAAVDDESEAQLHPPTGDVWITLDLGAGTDIYGLRLTPDAPETAVPEYAITTSSVSEGGSRRFGPIDVVDGSAPAEFDFPENTRARFVRVELFPHEGQLPAVREIEVFTDEYRLMATDPEIADTASQLRYYNARNHRWRTSELVAGFLHDGGPDQGGLYAYHYDAVEFAYTDLDPSRLYWLDLTYPADGGRPRAQALIVNGVLVHGDEVSIGGEADARHIFFVPPEAYRGSTSRDGTVDLDVATHRLAGPNAAVAQAILWTADPTRLEGPATPQGPLAKATRPVGAIALDGRLDDWDRLYPIHPRGDGGGRPYCLLSWDDDNLYLAVDAPRGPFGAGTSLADRLDVFIDSRPPWSPTIYEDGDLHLSFLRFGSAREIPRVVIHGPDVAGGQPDEPPVEFASVRRGDRYIFEARLPRVGLLDLWQPARGTQIRFNYILASRSGALWSWAAPSIYDPPMRWRPVELLGSIRADCTIVVQSRYPHEFTGRPADSFEAGDGLWIVVRDPDANKDSSRVEHTTVRASGEGGFEPTTVRLTEADIAFVFDVGLEEAASADSEHFVGRIDTRYGDVGAEEADAVPVLGGETIRFAYHDASADPQGGAAEVEAAAAVRIGTTGSLALYDEAGGRLTSLASGDVLHVRIDDADLPSGEAADAEAAPGGPSVVVRTMPMGGQPADAVDVERVTLAAADGAGFEGALPTQYGEVGTHGDGILQVSGDVRVEAAFRDRLQDTGRTDVPVVASARVDIGATALLRVRRPGADFDRGAVGVPAGTPIIVHVADADAASIGDNGDTRVVSATGDRSADRVAATLRELGPGSGDFQGLINTSYGPSALPDNDTLEVQGGETVRIVYLDRLQGSGATDVSVAAEARVLEGADAAIEAVRADYIKPLDRLNAGDTLHLRVEEADDVGSVVTVTAVSEATGDTETVQLRRSTATGNEFLGSIQTQYSRQSAPHDGTLQVGGAESIRATYVDELTASGETHVLRAATATTNTGSDGHIAVMRELDPLGRTGSAVDAFKAGDVLVVEVRDPDVNRSFDVIERTFATISEELHGDTVEVELEETNGNSGVFQRRLQTEYGMAAVSDGILQVQGRSAVAVRYVDALRESGEPQVALDARLFVQVGTSGTVRLLALDGRRELRSISAGDTVLVEVADDDLNVDATRADGAEVSVVANVLGDHLALPLVETGSNTGRFRARMMTEYHNVADGSQIPSDDMVLQLTDKEVVTVTYVDELRSTGEPSAPASARIVVGGSREGALLIVDIDGVEASDILAGDALHLALRDLLLTTLPSLGAATVVVRGDMTFDYEEIELVPVPGERGTFASSIPTEYGLTPRFDGILTVQGGETIRATYASQSPLGAPQVVDTTRVAVGARARVDVIRPDGVAVEVLSPGDVLVLRVDDADRNVDPELVDSVTVRVSARLGAVERGVALAETGVATGVFRGELLTTLGRPVGSGDALPLLGAETIQVLYQEAIIHTGQTDVPVTTECRVRRVAIAPFSGQSIVVDGIPDQWPLENVVKLGDGVGLAWAQWTRDALYVFVEVTDDDVDVRDVRRWYEASDAVEIMINTSPGVESGSATSDGSERTSEFGFWICPLGGGKSGELPYVGRTTPSLAYNFRQITAAVRVRTDAYALEVRIPFGAALPGFDPVTSETRGELGFNILVHRSDGTQVWWARPPGTEAAPSGEAVLYLRRPPTGIAKVAAPTQ